MAVQAAFADPRFCALQPEELDQIDIEISVLTPLERIQNPSQIEIGKHGIWIRKGAYSGLLLPQVAIEQKWDRNTFLEWTCRKADYSLMPGKNRILKSISSRQTFSKIFLISRSSVAEIWTYRKTPSTDSKKGLKLDSSFQRIHR
jgi:uncharacterized protein (TIGR00296 family)